MKKGEISLTGSTDVAANPIPAQPSQESVAQLAKSARMRRGMERSQPHGLDLRINRAIFASVAATVRAPKGGSARSTRAPRGRLVTAPGADRANGILLWIHGGSFITGTPRGEQPLATGYANLAQIPAFLPHYRRPPEHPFPAAADDVLAAYRSLLDQGFPAEKIRLGGISAGGALTVGLLTDLRRTGLPMPSAVLLVSPVLQLSTELAQARDARQPDPLCSPNYIERTNRAFVGATPLSDPRLDHLNADTTGWPPVLIQIGDTECLADEAAALAARIREQGGQCELQVWPGQVHAFPMIGARVGVPEAAAALDYGARFFAAQPRRNQEAPVTGSA